MINQEEAQERAYGKFKHALLDEFDSHLSNLGLARKGRKIKKPSFFFPLGRTIAEFEEMPQATHPTYRVSVYDSRYIEELKEITGKIYKDFHKGANFEIKTNPLRKFLDSVGSLAFKIIVHPQERF